MTLNVCPVPTPAQARWTSALNRIRAEMLEAVHAAIRDAADKARAELGGAGPDLPPPPHGYFVAVVQQNAFCALCGADPDTFEGGDARLAFAVIQNNQNIAMRYWRAEPASLAPPPRESDRR